MAIASVQILYRSPVGFNQGFALSATTASAPAVQVDKQLVIGVANITTNSTGTLANTFNPGSIGLSTIDYIKFEPVYASTTAAGALATMYKAVYDATSGSLRVGVIDESATTATISTAATTASGAFQFIAFGGSALDALATHTPV